MGRPMSTNATLNQIQQLVTRTGTLLADVRMRLPNGADTSEGYDIATEGALIASRVLGADNSHVRELNKIGIQLLNIHIRAFSGLGEVQTWLDYLIKALNSMKEDAASVLATLMRRVFIVHGHDEEMKQAVARTITQLGLEPIILHEKP